MAIGNDSFFDAQSNADYCEALREAAKKAKNGSDDWKIPMAGIVLNPLRTLIIIRGLPGSGKSTLARAIMTGYNLSGFYKAPACAHFESDMYFYHGDTGHYKYDSAKFHEAEAWCLEATKRACEGNLNLIVVSNPFVRLHQIQPYQKLAKDFNYTYQEILCTGNFPNIHGKSEEIISRMRKHFQYRPSEYGITALSNHDK